MLRSITNLIIQQRWTKLLRMSSPYPDKEHWRPQNDGPKANGSCKNRTFSPVPKRVMNGSEDTDVLPAAVLSGAPIELEARTVRYVLALPTRSDLTLCTLQNLQRSQNRNPIWRLAQPPLAHGLGHSLQRSPMGESLNGLAILCRFHARHTYQLQEQGGCC